MYEFFEFHHRVNDPTARTPSELLAFCRPVTPLLETYNLSRVSSRQTGLATSRRSRAGEVRWSRASKCANTLARINGVFGKRGRRWGPKE